MGNSCTTGSHGRVENVREQIPSWVFSAETSPKSQQDTWGRHSDGFTILDKNTIQRHRKAQNHSDGCQWGRAFSKGKHVFEVIYPFQMRGGECTAGVALNNASLYHVGRGVLIGGNRESWGVHLRTKRTYHRGEMMKRYPPGATNLADRFYMYLDCDSGTLAFACDDYYYGVGLAQLPTGEDLYLSFSCLKPNSMITVIYRGEGKPGAPMNMKERPAAPSWSIPQMNVQQYAADGN